MMVLELDLFLLLLLRQRIQLMKHHLPESLLLSCFQVDHLIFEGLLKTCERESDSVKDIKKK